MTFDRKLLRSAFAELRKLGYIAVANMGTGPMLDHVSVNGFGEHMEGQADNDSWVAAFSRTNRTLREIEASGDCYLHWWTPDHDATEIVSVLTRHGFRVRPPATWHEAILVSNP